MVALQKQGTVALHAARANLEVGAISLSVTWWTKDGDDYLGHSEFGVSVCICRVCFAEVLVMISVGTWTRACACADASANKLRHRGTWPLRRRKTMVVAH
jgi:hypothetical protein